MTAPSDPVVNLNGTSASELVNQRLDVVEALRKALELMRAMTPHGRDYQTVEASRYHEAVNLFHYRFDQVNRVANEILAEANRIQEDRHG